MLCEYASALDWIYYISGSDFRVRCTARVWMPRYIFSGFQVSNEIPSKPSKWKTDHSKKERSVLLYTARSYLSKFQMANKRLMAVFSNGLRTCDNHVSSFYYCSDKILDFIFWGLIFLGKHLMVKYKFTTPACQSHQIRQLRVIYDNINNVCSHFRKTTS